MLTGFKEDTFKLVTTLVLCAGATTEGKRAIVCALVWDAVRKQTRSKEHTYNLVMTPVL